MVTEASTLRAIQTEHGITGSFKDKPLSEWLMRHNPTDLSYKAVSLLEIQPTKSCSFHFVLCHLKYSTLLAPCNEHGNDFCCAVRLKVH